MAALALTYSDDEFGKLLNKEVGLSDFLQNVMKYDGDDAVHKGNKQLIMAQLVSYHNHTGAAPQIEDFEIVW
jgi:hypothetical protein